MGLGGAERPVFLSIVSPDVVGKAYGDLLRNIMLAKDVSFDHAGFLCLCEIGHALGQDGIAVVCSTVFGKETDETLGFC